MELCPPMDFDMLFPSMFHTLMLPLASPTKSTFSHRQNDVILAGLGSLEKLLTSYRFS